ncbi:MAG: redoxin domain-containing protein [Anaerolineaceae bacterium]|nr:redoxin domain-containing protein [Anaerolineaceae bacterium]
MNHMTQLRQDYQRFMDLNTEILVMVPNGPKMIEKHIQKNNTPYRILSDKGLKVAAQYFQVKKFFAVGTPTVFLVNQKGEILYTFYGKSVQEVPKNAEPLAVLQKLN